MTNEQFNQLLNILTQIAISQDRIATAIERQTPAQPAPNIQRPLSEFRDFNWASIGAEVVKGDQYGAGVVIWEGKQFLRRSPENQFGVSIWFARCVGKDQDGRNKYERLITFKPIQEQKLKPISREAEAILRK
ncbi:MAG: hypothetical protein F6K47_38020 [Symploca sp. SIO2E6]|nr:hypothetical protein [Symploca sp. SIO2E6]